MAGRLSWRTRPSLLIFGAIGMVIVLCGAVAYFTADLWRSNSMPVKGSAAPSLTAAELSTVDNTRVFFGHQSVGENILGGVDAVYAEHSLTAPLIEQGRTPPKSDAGFIVHDFIGENGAPLAKIEDFDKIMRGGMGLSVDVALMKFCFIDITGVTDIDEVFTHYRDTIEAMQRDFPGVRFVHMTVPLTTEPTLMSKLKTRVVGGNDNPYSQAGNVARERYNNLLRNEYGGDNLIDLAALESTAPNGEQDARRYNGQQYFSLYQGYASDLGHLNHLGSEIAATAFLGAVAAAARV